MKLSNTLVLAAFAAAMTVSGIAGAQKPKTLSAQNFYYDDYEWPLPAEGTTTMTLTGMKSAHAVWITFVKFIDGKAVTDSPVMTLLEGSTVKWAQQGACTYELQLVNANPPVINMNKPPAMCSLRAGGKVIFKILATQ